MKGSEKKPFLFFVVDRLAVSALADEGRDVDVGIDDETRTGFAGIRCAKSVIYLFKIVEKYFCKFD